MKFVWFRVLLISHDSNKATGVPTV